VLGETKKVSQVAWQVLKVALLFSILGKVLPRDFSPLKPVLVEGVWDRVRSWLVPLDAGGTLPRRDFWNSLIKELLEEIESRKLKAFLKTYEKINKRFSKIFARLSPGGKAFTQLEKEDEPFEGGINLVVKPRGKEVQYLEAISGGKKTLGVFLDKANARMVGELIKERSQTAKFIVVTLREVLANFTDELIGVSLTHSPY
jgi:hypothetical protein